MAQKDRQLAARSGLDTIVRMNRLLFVLLLLTALSLAPGPAALGAAKVNPVDDPVKRQHWAFKAPVRPPVPATARKVTHPIDAFIVARLEKEGLALSPAADRVTLLRRLHLDLTGLPPQPEEVDAFLADTTPEAYQKAVDRLLASPHFGERWGRHWLDAARYADSDGFEKDKPRVAYFYRDWVINALNRDLPYDQFIIEQIAGDQLPGATQDQIVATGFLRNSLLNEEGGVDPEQFRAEAMFDRMEALGKSVLGLTIQCCQCHDHKFDPITQQEYYQLFAWLNHDYEGQPLVYTAAEEMQRAGILRGTAELEAELKHRRPEWEARMTAWEDDFLKKHDGPWHTIQPDWEPNSLGGEKYLPQTDGSILAQSYQPTHHEPYGPWKSPIPKIGAFKMEVMMDPNLPCRGPGRSFMGTFGITEFKVDGVKWKLAAADIAPPTETPVHPNFQEKKPVRRVIGPAEYAIDGKTDTAWSNDVGPGLRNRACDIVFIPEQPVSAADGKEFIVRISQNHGGWNSDDIMANNPGRFRLSVAESADPDIYRVPRPVRDVLAIPRDRRSPAQQAAVFTYWRTLTPEWKDVNDRIAALWRSHPEGTTQMVLEARQGKHETRMFKRGDWLKPGDLVTAGVPAILHPLPEKADATRLTLARWLTDRRSPTTARAFVNRAWQALFGIGILETSEDLGTQSPPPSHPELLDWLACEFMDRGWSVKTLLRTIVMSETYRQSSHVSPALLERDPSNRLLARGARFRLEGEVIRDVQLSASGLLDLKMGGRSLKPAAPVYLFQPPASYAPFPWVIEEGSDRYRRAIYTVRRRSTPYPMLAIFDTPDGSTSCVRRARSNTPLQALTGLNEQISVEAARALARRMTTAAAADDARLTAGFRFVCARPPTTEELSELRGLLNRTRARLTAGALHPWELATGDKATVPSGLPAGVSNADVTAFTAAARVLLNLDEALTRE